MRFVRQPRQNRIARQRRHNAPSGQTVYETMEARQLMHAAIDVVYPADFVGPLAFSHGQISGQQFERIINGTVTSQYPSVGLIGDNTGFFCSGTLIGSRYVLTAAHCAEGVGQTAGRFQVGSQIYSTSQIFVHPGYNDNLIGSDNANDIAIYKLDRDVTGIAPSQIFRGTPAVGQLLTLVGFGGGGNGNTGTDGSFGTKRVGTTPIDQVSSRLIYWNFDNNSESNTAPGDSGGPAFVSVNGVLQVAGVTSGGDQANAGIGDRSFDTRVDAYAAWIDSIVGVTSNLPTISIAAADATAAETRAGQTPNPASFTISRTGSLAAPLTVSLATSGTATSTMDYTALAALVTIPAGSASRTVTLSVLDDLISEGTESVVVALVGGTGYQISMTAKSTSLAILDNDVATWNNNFANRFTMSGALTTVTGTNVGATRELGEPNVLGISGGKTIWWQWTAPATGSVTLTTSGSGFDTTLGVYTGTSVNGLTFVRANDDQDYTAGVLTSRVTFYAPAGQTYQFVVDGYSGAAGSVRLTVDQPAGRSAKRSFDPGLVGAFTEALASGGRQISRTSTTPARAAADEIDSAVVNQPSGNPGCRDEHFGAALAESFDDREAGGYVEDEAFATCLAIGFFDEIEAGIG